MASGALTANFDRVVEMLASGEWATNIEDSRARLLDGPIFDPAVEASFDQLETHLREGVLTEEEAGGAEATRTVIAVRRIGAQLFVAAGLGVAGAGPTLLLLGQLAHAILLKYPLLGLATGLVDVRGWAIAWWRWTTAADS